MTVTVASFRAAYPEFDAAAASDVLVQRYIDEAALWVGPHWCGNDGADEDKGTMLYVAHTIQAVAEGVDTSNVSAIGSGSHKISLRDTSSGEGRWNSTRYGRMFWLLVKRYSGRRIFAV